MSRHEPMARPVPAMSQPDIFEVIQRLRTEGQPFCLATVVRTADLTSAKAGAKAVITADGTIIGHLGGSCVRTAVARTAGEVLRSGAARMISVRPERTEAAEPDGTIVHVSGCPSKGTVDLFVEPYLVALRLAVVGDTPIAAALRAHGALMGWSVVTASEGDAPADAVVIASQGAGDLSALRSALSGDARLVAMVASHRKAAHLRARLAAEGVDAARLDRVISPAGLDIGAIDPHEIAVSILAQLVSWRRERLQG